MEEENRYYLVYAPSLNEAIEQEFTLKIVSLGSRLKLSEGMFLLETKSNAKEIFEKLKFESFDIKCLVLEIKKESSYGYWNPEVWKFLKILKEKKND